MNDTTVIWSATARDLTHLARKPILGKGKLYNTQPKNYRYQTRSFVAPSIVPLKKRERMCYRFRKSKLAQAHLSFLARIPEEDQQDCQLRKITKIKN